MKNYHSTTTWKCIRFKREIRVYIVKSQPFHSIPFIIQPHGSCDRDGHASWWYAATVGQKGKHILWFVVLQCGQCWTIYPYSSQRLYWHWANQKPLPSCQQNIHNIIECVWIRPMHPLRIDDITKTNHSTTKPCSYFMERTTCGKSY